jgi:hypothetical protein
MKTNFAYTCKNKKLITHVTILLPQNAMKPFAVTKTGSFSIPLANKTGESSTFLILLPPIKRRAARHEEQAQ